MMQRQAEMDWWKLNQYLSSKDKGNEELFAYLKACKDQMGNYRYGKSDLDVEAIRNQMQLEGAEQEMTILQESQEAICVDMQKRSNQIAELERELKRTIGEVNDLKGLVQRYRKNEHPSLCSKAQREANLLIQPAKIKEIRADTEQITAKIELTALLQLNIDGLMLQNKRRQHQIKKRIEQASKPSNNYSAMTLKTRDEIQAEIDSLKLKLSSLQQGTVQAPSYQSQHEFLRCIQERKCLQQHFLQEQQQKRQFYELLTVFKSTFKNAKQKNKTLKKLISDKGLPLPTLSAKQNPQP